MKKIVLLIVVCISALSVRAQDEEFKTIFQRKSNERISISGFGGPSMSFTTINEEFAVLMGGGGGVIVGNFFFGGYGMGLVNELQYKNETDPDYLLNFGHGGLWSGYTFQPRHAVHASLSCQMGWGSVAKALKMQDGDREAGKNFPIFILTPIAQVEFNFSRYFRLGTGVSYSFVSGQGVTQTNYTAKDFGIPAFYLLLSFGWFD